MCGEVVVGEFVCVGEVCVWVGVVEEVLGKCVCLSWLSGATLVRTCLTTCFPSDEQS